MKKTIKAMLTLAMCAVAVTFTSCSKDDDVPAGPSQQEIEAKIIGKWKMCADNGIEVLTNKKAVVTYATGGKCYSSHSDYKPDTQTWVWESKGEGNYSIKGNTLFEKNSENMEFTYTVTQIDDSSLTKIWNRPEVGSPEPGGDGAKPDGGENRPDDSATSIQSYTKITADYSNDIIGLWEGVAMTGYETYGGIEARIEYKADGTYLYYKKEDGVWTPLADVFDEWSVDGDWLATRWQNEGSDQMNYEWWDIDYIKDDEMKWSALRENEDGTRFNTTFIWKKIQ